MAALADHGVQDDLVAVLVGSGGVAAEDHRQFVLVQTDSAQRPQVVVVEGGGADVHGHPAGAGLGCRAVAQYKAVQRLVSVDSGGIGSEHAARGYRSVDPSGQGSGRVAVPERKPCVTPQVPPYQVVYPLDRTKRNVGRGSGSR